MSTETTHADTLGLRIRAARSRAGLFQRELAESVGVSAHHLCRVERDRLKPSVVLVGKIAKACGVAFEDLAGNEAA